MIARESFNILVWVLPTFHLAIRNVAFVFALSLDSVVCGRFEATMGCNPDWYPEEGCGTYTPLELHHRNIVAYMRAINASSQAVGPSVSIRISVVQLGFILGDSMIIPKGDF